MTLNHDLALPMTVVAALIVPAPSLAQECVAPGGCTGDVPAGMCGTSTDRIETGIGCDLNNCQEPEILGGPTIEIEPGPLTLNGPPTFVVRMAFEVKSPWNIWARENNPNGQLQARWLDPSGRVSACHSNLADTSKVWVQKTMTCADMWSARDVGGTNTSVGQYSLVVASCGPPCNPDTERECPTLGCHRWVEKKAAFTISDEQLEQFCPPKRCPEGTCCPAGPAASGPPGFGLGGGGGWGVGGRGGSPGVPGQSLTTAVLKTGPDPSLGRFWSHTFAERIVPRSDPGHVWLFTEDAIYWEFWDLDGDGTFDKSSPTDIESTLRKVGAEWELRAFDGTVKEYGADGRWTATSDRNGNTVAGSYSNGVLERVDMPDARSLTFTYHVDGLLASATEVGVDGITSRTWSHTWEGSDLTRIDRPDGTAWLFRYDDPANPGYLTRRILRGSNGGLRIVEAREYDAYGNLARSWEGDESPTGPNAVGLTVYSYPDPWNATERNVTDPLGVLTTTAWRRDPDSNVPLVTSSSGDCSTCGVGPNAQQFYQDPANPMKVTRSVDARGTVTLSQYDGNGQVVSRTEAFMTDLERTTAWEYDETYPSLVTAIEQPSTSGSGLRRTSWTYDSEGNATVRTVEGVENGSAFSYSTVTAYNSAGLPQSIDPPGFASQDKTTFTYDAARGDQLPLSRTDPLIGATTFDYDALNRRTRVTDVNGVPTETTYDNLDRVTAVILKGATAAGDLVMTNVYNEFGDLFRTILPEGNVIEYDYDAAGRLLSIERKPDETAHGERTLFTLDGIGNRVREDLQRWDDGWVTESFTGFVYSTRCHLDKVLHADGTVTEFAYDCEGNLEREWDANHPSENRTRPPTQAYSYDVLDRLVTVTQPWTGVGGGKVVTAYDYDVQDHLVRVTDANGTVTSYVYSDRDLLTEEVSEVSGRTTFRYNEHGELIEEKDARGVTVLRQVDALDRVRFVDYPDAALDVTYRYDEPAVPFSKGRLTAIERAGEAVTYRHDRFGRLIQDGTLQYSYDRNGNRVTVVYPGGMTARFSYDFADRQSTLALEGAGSANGPLVTAASYLPSGPLARLELGNGLTEIRDFDSRYFPERITVPEVFDWAYTTDAVGNITAIADGLDPARSRTFSYQDVHYFLTLGNGPWGSLSWSYDKIGNRLSETRDGVTATYSYFPNASGGTSPKLTAVSESEGETTRYFYDSIGALTVAAEANRKIRYRYDDAKRLSQIAHDSPDEPPALTDLRYDGRGFLRRAELRRFPTHAASQPSVETTATYSSEGLLYQRDHLERPDPAAPRGTPVTADDVMVFYFAGRPVAQVVVASQGEVVSFLTTDHLGAPVLSTNGVREDVWSGGFEPFGGDWSGANSSGVFLRLPGQWVDSGWRGGLSGGSLYYNLHRWYGFQDGRYLRPDPLGERSTDMNVYVYAASNPLNTFDPFGLYTIDGGCRCPLDPRLDLDDLKREVDEICKRLQVLITDRKLRKCLEKSCARGKIICRDDCLPGRGGENPRKTFLGRPLKNRKAILCRNNFGETKPPSGWLGNAVIHEWAHGCKWDHGDGKGVPIDPGPD